MGDFLCSFSGEGKLAQSFYDRREPDFRSEEIEIALWPKQLTANSMKRLLPDGLVVRIRFPLFINNRLSLEI